MSDNWKFIPPERRRRGVPNHSGHQRRLQDHVDGVHRQAELVKNAVVLLFVFFMGLIVGAGINACKADGWATTDKVLFGTYLAASAVDAKQTIDCMHLPNCHEANPLFGGEHPSAARIVGQKTLIAGLLWWAADAFPHSRRALLAIGNAVEIGVVAHNASIGLKVGF